MIKQRGMFAQIPELPNFIEILHKHFAGSSWASVLYRWENLVFSIIAGILITLLLHLGIRKHALIPHGVQNALEWALEVFEKLILGILGPEGRKHLPFLGTLFFYILMMNWLGLIPLMKSPSSNLNITAAMGISVFCYVQYLNIKNMGIFGFLYHLAGSPKGVAGWLLVPVIFPLELISQISRPVTLSLRLFGNILGEHILLGVFAVLGLVFVSYISFTVTLPLQIPFVFLALLTGFMQALVFTMLSTVYILLSSPHQGEQNLKQGD
jgi:F-type H+-transporting ATPase subunit a